MKMFMRKITFLSLSLILVGAIYYSVSGSVFAQTTAISLQAQLDLITQLTRQIQELQAKLTALRQQRSESVITLVKTLGIGSRGDDVKILQALLAADPDIYPEGVISGYYGQLTAKAVKKYQAKRGLPQVGNVGPKTLEHLNIQASSTTPISLEDQIGNGKKPCAKVPPGHLIAPGWLRKQGGVLPIVPPCQILPPGIAKKIYPVATTTPPGNDVTPPSITSLNAGNITASGATITWITNEPAKSKVYYGTVFPLNLGSSTSMSDMVLMTGHALTLSGLSASTTYHYVAESADTAGNIATSSERSFTTSMMADVTPPVISSVTSSGISSTTATITWSTNEYASSKVYYGTTTPLNIGTATMVSDISLVMSHSKNLTGLLASTTHYYIVESKDSSNNMATSSEYSFITGQ